VELLSRWRWSNIPVPEVYVVLLVAALAVHLFLPLRMFPAAWIGHAAGWPPLLAGAFLAGWAVAAAASMDIARPTGIVTSGPYRFSRNPMYLGWTFISLGVGLVLNSGWVVMLLPGALLFLQLVTISHEERSLEKRFGQSYLTYKRNVRRWL
jgi:protein-S-isoprenylcysteine O-methyltransferase Ste14